MQSFDSSPEYYRMREAQERFAADSATSEDLRQVHLALADKYADLAEEAQRADKEA